MLEILNTYDKRLIKKGITGGAKLLSINGNPVSDQLDVFFFSDEEKNLIEYLDTEGGKKTAKITPLQLTQIELEPLKPKKCGAHCIFCFVEQLPTGLRKSLYHKDEDYRFSYLYGNYVALANITSKDLKKIARYRLSPLYISVHTTDAVLRGKMLGLKKPAPILPHIRFLTEKGIDLHCQIVLCPDINDGKKLEETISDLSKFYPKVASVAVVPVGLTSHRENLYPLKQLDAKKALKVIEQLKPIQNSLIKTLGTPFVFLSDEFYLLAEKPLPPKKFYGDFPQIENGVGITRKVIDDADTLFQKNLANNLLTDKKVAIITGTLAYNTLLPYVQKLAKITSINIKLYAVENRLLGNSITVTGLISGKDILDSLKDKEFDILLLPNVMLKDRKNTFIDDVTTYDIRRHFNSKVYTFTPLFSELYKKLLKLSKG